MDWQPPRKSADKVRRIGWYWVRDTYLREHSEPEVMRYDGHHWFSTSNHGYPDPRQYRQIEVLSRVAPARSRRL